MIEELIQSEEEISIFKPPFKIGDRVFDFELQDMNGIKVKLSDLLKLLTLRRKSGRSFGIRAYR